CPFSLLSKKTEMPSFSSSGNKSIKEGFLSFLIPSCPAIIFILSCDFVLFYENSGIRFYFSPFFALLPWRKEVFSLTRRDMYTGYLLSNPIGILFAGLSNRVQNPKWRYL